MTFHNFYFIKHSIFTYPFIVSYYLIHCSFTVPKSADFTIICESQQISPSWPCWSLQIHVHPNVMSALVARDHIPSNIADLSNHICLCVLTKGDGTPFDASFILEEDIIEICVQFGHTHPEGVLHYSAFKSVMLFHTTDELQITTHRVLKALTLCDETIKVQTSPPSAAHMWAYMAVVNGKLSGTQPLPSNGEEGHHLSPSNPHPGGRTPQHLQANFGDVTDNELWQLMEELCREIALWELNAPPESHHKHLGGILWEMGILMQITGRSPFQEGRVGSLQQPFWPPGPAQPDRGWEPRGQPPCPQLLFNLMRM